MQRIRTKRTSRRAQNTRVIREATTLLRSTDVEEIEATLRKLDVNYEEVKKLNTDLEPFIADGDLEAEYLSVMKYKEQTTSVFSLLRSRATQLLSNEPPRPAASAIGFHNEERGERRRSGVKLPGLQLQPFKGDLSEWQPFCQQFKRVVHDNDDLSNGEKFQYLKTLVNGPARASIAGLPVADAHYNDAIESLTRQFEDARLIQKEHLAIFKLLPPQPTRRG
ncbi:uncharacterized protein LOC120848874 [Ixodes scapularis]|uniref:uncharacterized protein LOC120848874 n=1 Tax=Ixodes scapularis TaxID=6945 RepID=UPI001A9EFDA9|nr:uncharacterized protein LOC120848874 [Ixodes scapularis]